MRGVAGRARTRLALAVLVVASALFSVLAASHARSASTAPRDSIRGDDTPEIHPRRRAVLLLSPPGGYRLPDEKRKFGALETSRCFECHGIGGFLARDSASGEVLKLSVDSVTYRRAAHRTLACTQCHGDVREYPHVFKGRRPRLGCDADCHASDRDGRAVRHDAAMAAQRRGAHARGLAGDADTPDCVYCHGEGDPHAGPSVAAMTPGRRLELCASCHESDDRMARSKLDVDAVSSYRGGFHYKAFRLGNARAALCADCHGAHDVRAERDTASTTHPAHLAATCGRKGCHAGASARFAGSETDHLEMRAHRGALANRAGRLLAWAGGAVLLAMALLVLIDLQRPLRATGSPDSGAPLVPRLSLAMRWQHAALSVTFTLLALTGLPLRWPDATPMRALNAAFGGWEGARAAHRAAGALLGLVALVHVVVACVRLVNARFAPGRAWPMLPTAADAREAWQAALYHARLRPAPPSHGRHEFRARVHYLAVLWGVPVMALTGLVLWFGEPLAGRLPRSAIAIATAVHGEEALIAIAVVLLWHLYNVHFAPGRGLRFGTFLDGRVTARNQAAVHAGEAAPASPADATPPAARG